MKYLCLVYHEEEKIAAMPEHEINGHIANVLEYREVLRAGGHLIVSDALQFVESATTLRVRGDKLSITDGPFAETKEQLGGFYLIEATDLDEAIRLTSKMPPVRLGCIEVRPIRELTLPAVEGA